MDGRNSPTNKANWAYKHYSFRFERPPLEDMFKDNLRKNSDSKKKTIGKIFLETKSSFSSFFFKKFWRSQKSSYYFYRRVRTTLRNK